MARHRGRRKFTFKTYKAQQGFIDLRVYKDGEFYDEKLVQPKDLAIFKEAYKDE